MSEPTPPTDQPTDIDCTSDHDEAFLEAMAAELFGDEEDEEARGLESICDRDGGRAADVCAAAPLVGAFGYGIFAWEKLGLLPDVPNVDFIPLVLVGISGLVGVSVASTAAESTDERLRLLSGTRARMRKNGETLEQAAGHALRMNQLKACTKWTGIVLALAVTAQAGHSIAREGVQVLAPKHVVSTLAR